MSKVTLVGATLVCLALAACGGGDGDNASQGNSESKSSVSRFEGDGFAFTYPEDWVQGKYAKPNPNLIAPAIAVSYPGTEEGTLDSVAVTVAPDQTAITEENLDDSLSGLAEYAASAYGKLQAGPTATTIDGLPAVRLEASGPNPEGGQVRFRTEIVFDGTTWYVVQCEFSPEGAEKLKPGCDQVMESFEVE